MAKALVGVDVVVHLAAYKQVGESTADPARYFLNNVGGMVSLLSSMDKAGVRRILYSSSAAVYGTQRVMPIREDASLQPDSPYGLTKAQGERQLEFMVQCREWSAVSLRYFNPVGAHPSGLIGEPFEYAASLVPRALKGLALDNETFSIFGTDYDTPDGTCLRDYIHVCDLAKAHLAALAVLERPGHHVFNVGTGRPHSVREVLATCGRVSGLPVSVEEGPRRPGDVAVCQADPSAFERAVGFRATRGLDEMVESAWRWWCQNPNGYQTERRQKIAVNGGDWSMKFTERRANRRPTGLPQPPALLRS